MKFTKIIGLGAFLVGVCLIFLGIWWFGINQSGPQLGIDQTTGTPSYKPLTTESSISGGKVKSAAYDTSKQVYSFQDTYHGSLMTISQQPISEKMQSNPTGLKDLADSLGATEKLNTSLGEAFLATKDTDSSQRLVVVHEKTLVFIFSQKTLPKSLWGEYVRSLN